MCDTPNNPPEQSAAHTEDKEAGDYRQKVNADFERELLLYIITQLQDRGLITSKTYENAVKIILGQ